MKAAIAFILEGEAHAAVRRITLELQQTAGMGLRGVQLPVHVSLKQPFQVLDLIAFERYFDEFAASLQPQSLTLTGLQFWNHDGVLISFVDVLEDAALRPIHERLNRELSARFGNADAPFDSKDYHFHATVSIEHVNPSALKVLEARVGERFDLLTVADTLGLFVYTDDDFAPLSYITYKLTRVGLKERT